MKSGIPLYHCVLPRAVVQDGPVKDDVNLNRIGPADLYQFQDLRKYFYRLVCFISSSAGDEVL